MALTLLTSLSAVALSCGGADIQPRFASVNTTLTALGLDRAEISTRGSLEAGAEARMEVELTAGTCYTFLVLGSGGAEDVGVRLLTAGNERKLAEDHTIGKTAAIHACPDESGGYELVVRMNGAAGEYAIRSWSGTAAAGAVAGTCGDVTPLTLGGTVEGSTQGRADQMKGSCVETSSAPEQVYSFELQETTRLTVTVTAEFDAAAYIVTGCGPQAREIACNDDERGGEEVEGDEAPKRSVITTSLEAGRYFLVVDGYASESGRFELRTSFGDSETLAGECGAAESMTLGQDVTGSTDGAMDSFRASCGDGLSAPDRVYRLTIAEEARLRVTQSSQHDGGLHLRSSCADVDAEVACNDDYLSQTTSVVAAVVNAGDYYLIADGYDSDASGTYTLQANLAPRAGDGATPGTSCRNAIALGANGSSSVMQIDTFRATDELSGSCGGAGAPDIAHSLRLRRRTQVRIAVAGAAFDGVVYVQKECGQRETEVSCTSFRAAGPREQPLSAVDVTLDAGTYTIVVDGGTPAGFGALDLAVTALSAVPGAAEKCRGGPLLQSGQEVTGSTIAHHDNFRGSCSEDGTSSPDAVYRLKLQRAGQVAIDLRSHGFDAVLHLRRDCAEESSEVACNDDFSGEDLYRARIEQHLDAGTYFVIVDGLNEAQGGAYTLRADF